MGSHFRKVVFLFDEWIFWVTERLEILVVVVSEMDTGFSLERLLTFLS